MILKGSQRGGSQQLAIHLLRTDDNEHVEVHGIRGFISQDLAGALREAYAVSRGTRCKQFLFSLSLNPPETEPVPIEVFETAIVNIEEQLGLAGQPRVLVFHEKKARRHAHCVWSRIDVDQMRAINLPYFKRKLRDVSKQLYLEQEWKMPLGFVDSQERNPLNYTLAEWQQAKRVGRDPKALKTMFQECWVISDSRKAFAAALEARGYYLARGDRRGFVAVDYKGEVYAIAKWTGIRTKKVRERLGDLANLPSVHETKTHVADLATDKLRSYVGEINEQFARAADVLNCRRLKMVHQHRQARRALKMHQSERWDAETRERAARFRRGLRGLWDIITGKNRRIRIENEQDTNIARKRDQVEWQNLIVTQLAVRRPLQRQITQTALAYTAAIRNLNSEISEYSQVTKEPHMARRKQRRNTQNFDF